jgi:hypothetical protein
LVAVAAQASVDLTHVDSHPLLDGHDSKPPGEIATSDDLARLILVGPNGVIDPPTLAGNRFVENTLSSSPRIESSAMTTNQSPLVQLGIAPRESSAVNSNASVRFETSNMKINPSFYEDLMLLRLRGSASDPAEPGFVLPAPTVPTEVSASNDSPNLEPSSLLLIGVFLVAGWVYLRRKLAA